MSESIERDRRIGQMILNQPRGFIPGQIWALNQNKKSLREQDFLRKSVIENQLMAVILDINDRSRDMLDVVFLSTYSLIYDGGDIIIKDLENADAPLIDGTALAVRELVFKGMDFNDFDLCVGNVYLSTFVDIQESLKVDSFYDKDAKDIIEKIRIKILIRNIF